MAQTGSSCPGGCDPGGGASLENRNTESCAVRAMTTAVVNSEDSHEILHTSKLHTVYIFIINT